MKSILFDLKQHFCKTITTLAIGLSLMSVNVFSAAYAQSEARPNPLGSPSGDPLLPLIQRPLSPLERRLLRETLVEMDLEAKAALKAENEDEAFEIWYRYLRLHQKLTTLEEVEALGNVGEIAWDQTRGPDVQIIIERLIKIEQRLQKKEPLSPEFLKAFAIAYDQVHSIENALNIQEKILENNRNDDDIKAEEETLNKIGELYQAKFDYVNAAVTYERLLDIAELEDNGYTQGLYLQKLATIYTAVSRPENAIRIKKELADNYLANQNILALADLKISIGDDYVLLEEAEQASQNYQEAFSIAWSLQQFGAAGQALKRLGKLYEDNEQDDYALRIYYELIKVEQESYNYYGLMRTYDAIGLIHLERQQYQQARTVFEAALDIARSLKYQEDYFLAQLEKVNQQMPQ